MLKIITCKHLSKSRLLSLVYHFFKHTLKYNNLQTCLHISYIEVKHLPEMTFLKQSWNNDKIYRVEDDHNFLFNSIIFKSNIVINDAFKNICIKHRNNDVIYRVADDHCCFFDSEVSLIISFTLSLILKSNMFSSDACVFVFFNKK